jgi:hypothetical protein
MSDNTEEYEIGDEVNSEYDTREFKNHFIRNHEEICGICVYAELYCNQFPCSHCYIIHHEKEC